MPPPYQGSCLCGQVVFELKAEPITLYACHCTDCQRRSGGALLLSMWVFRDSLEVLQGATKLISSIARDSRERLNRVCPACEVRLWAEPVHRPRHAVLRPGLLQDAGSFQPIAHQFTRSALPWFVFPKGVALYETTPEDPGEFARLWRQAGATPGGSQTMSPDQVCLQTGEAPELQAYLAERIYEFNAQQTGCFDGELFSTARRDEAGVVQAGICGYTWAGCGYVTYLWVAEGLRGRGVGTELLSCAEEHAKARACKVMFLSTHSFQAPDFYRRLGYEQQAQVKDHPVGHSALIFAKSLLPTAAVNSSPATTSP